MPYKFQLPEPPLDFTSIVPIKNVEFTLVGPIFRAGDVPISHGIISDVLPFL